MQTAKGAVVDTAIIAGTMAVKRTHELIPFCHPLPIDGCRFEVDWLDATTLRIQCTVKTVHRTGVEMEALTGATVAALTVYDMCKALSHEHGDRSGEAAGQARRQARRSDSHERDRAVFRQPSRCRRHRIARCVDRPESLAELYRNLRARHGFSLAPAKSCAWPWTAHSPTGTQSIRDGAEIAFIPPVSGG